MKRLALFLALATACGGGTEYERVTNAWTRTGEMRERYQEALTVAVTYRKLLEVTHFHLFSMPVYLLILSHLFMLSRIGERAKVGWISLGTLGVAGHVAAPWLVRAGTAAAGCGVGGSRRPEKSAG